MNRHPKASLHILACPLALLITLSGPATATQTTAAPTQPAAAPAAQPFTEAELAALLAPIALYPDSVVAQILMAATYPIEVIQARRWLDKNKDLKGDALATQAKAQPWDDSVKSLVAAPEVLKMMDENLGWMQKLGDAFLAQQKDVFDVVQDLRGKAMDEGNLKSDDHMKVSKQAAPAEAAGSGDTEIIVIESANPEVVYVPTYNPTTIYGYWGYPAYPPYYWPPPYGYPGSGFWWGMGWGIAIGGIWGGCCWGGNDIDIDWNGGDINIGDGNRGDRVDHRRDGDRGRTGDRAGTSDRARAGDRSARTGDRAGAGGQKWSHNPEHRKGVSYRDSTTASKFGDRSGNRAASREAFRGRSGNMGYQGSAGSRAGSRDFSSGGRTGSGGTRDIGSGSRAGSRPSTSSRGSYGSGGRSYGGSRGSNSAFGGMRSGSRAGSYGSRGGMSRGGGGRGGGGGRRR